MKRRIYLIYLLGAWVAAAHGQAAIRVYFDRAHAQLPLPAGMADVAKKLNLDIVDMDQPVSAASLQGSRMLYLRAPSQAFSATEKEAVVSFVRKGGSLLLVLDEEKCQQLEVTGFLDKMVN